MSAGVKHVSDASFEQDVLKADKPVLLDFWAEWCGPCKQIDPVIHDIAVEKAGALTIAKLNVDDEGDVAARFSVMSIPTMILFKNGSEVQRFVGARGKQALLNDLAPFLG